MFTGSLKPSSSAWNGCVGLKRYDNGARRVLGPLMTATDFNKTGPRCPLGGTGLVAGDRAQAPFQTCCWWVTADLTVHGFVDYPGVGEDERRDDPAWRRRHFGGVPAPVMSLALHSEAAWIA